jgi:hypothetical protein
MCKSSIYFTALRAVTRGNGLQPCYISAAYLAHLPADFEKIRNCHKINVPTCSGGHLRLRRILPGWQDERSGITARRMARVNTQNELAGEGCALIRTESAPNVNLASASDFGGKDARRANES